VCVCVCVSVRPSVRRKTPSWYMRAVQPPLVGGGCGPGAAGMIGDSGIQLARSTHPAHAFELIVATLHWTFVLFWFVSHVYLGDC
jgi:hypothetical protein